jgi:hypothetical protein
VITQFAARNRAVGAPRRPRSWQAADRILLADPKHWGVTAPIAVAAVLGIGWRNGQLAGVAWAVAGTLFAAALPVLSAREDRLAAQARAEELAATVPIPALDDAGVPRQPAPRAGNPRAGKPRVGKFSADELSPGELNASERRLAAVGMGVMVAGAGLAIQVGYGAPGPVVTFTVATLVLSVVLTATTHRWRISVCSAIASAAGVALAFTFGPGLLLLAVPIAVMANSRGERSAHIWPETSAGLTLGTLATTLVYLKLH